MHAQRRCNSTGGTAGRRSCPLLEDRASPVSARGSVRRQAMGSGGAVLLRRRRLLLLLLAVLLLAVSMLLEVPKAGQQQRQPQPPVSRATKTKTSWSMGTDMAVVQTIVPAHRSHRQRGWSCACGAARSCLDQARRQLL